MLVIYIHYHSPLYFSLGYNDAGSERGVIYILGYDHSPLYLGVITMWPQFFVSNLPIFQAV